MTPLLSLLPWALVLGALLLALGSLLASVAFWLLLRLPTVQLPGTVTLVMPLTGAAPGLDRLLRALAQQSLQPRRLIISVESREDAAYARACALVDSHDKPVAFPISVVVAGAAERCAQKCWNQIAALHHLDAADDALVLMDADIMPQPYWLSALASPLFDGSADIVSGYRWPVVALADRPEDRLQRTVGAHLIAAIDRGIAALPRIRWRHLVWGGSMAFSRQALAVLKLEDVLSRPITDDCTIGLQARALGLRILVRAALRVPSPVDATPVVAWRFGRRQYQIIHIYEPLLWCAALLLSTLRVAAWCLLLVPGPLGLGIAEAGHPGAWAAAALLTMAVLGSLVQHRIARKLQCPDSSGVLLGQLITALFKPWVDIFHWILVLAAWVTRTINWGHLRYRVRGPRDVRVERTPTTIRS